MTRNLVFPALRQVYQAEARAWLTNNPASIGTSVVTSLPDISEMAGMSLSTWKLWFVAMARQIIEWLPEYGYAIFYQSDIRIDGKLIDKSFLVMLALEGVSSEINASLQWHKIVCRKPPGTIAMGRPSYSHMICIARNDAPDNKFLGADVIADTGPMLWSRAMGLHACEIACRYLRDATSTTVIVDPFCGKGSLLAVANQFGFNTVGIDISVARCRAARTITMTDF